MAFIEWVETLSVGVGEFDNQHKKLIGMINELHGSIEKDSEEETTRKTMGALFDYVDEHFRAEEESFTEYGYPETEGHKTEHKAFRGKLSDFQAGSDKGDRATSEKMLKFLGDWLFRHIQGTDKKYGPWLNAKGLR